MWQQCFTVLSQVLQDAAAVDAKAERGEDIRPLCGLPLAVKDAIDVVGFPTTCATPAFAGGRMCFFCSFVTHQGAQEALCKLYTLFNTA